MYFTAGGQRKSGFDKMFVFQSMDIITDRFLFESELLTPDILADDDVEVFVADQLRLKGRIDYLKKRRSKGCTIKGTDLTGTLIQGYPIDQTGEFKNQTVQDILNALCSPFGVSVSGETGETIKRYNFSFDTTIGDIIAQLCNRSALIANADSEGNLVLSDATSATSSGVTLAEGDNMHDMEVIIDLNMRFSDYYIYSQNKFGAFQDSEKVVSNSAGVTSRYKPFVKISSNQYEIADADREAAWRQQFQDGAAVSYMVEVPGIIDAEVNQLINVNSEYLGVNGQLLIKDIVFSSVSSELMTTFYLVSPSTYGGQEVTNELIK